MKQVRHVTVTQKEYNGIQYYRISFLDQESQWYTRTEVNDILKYWELGDLLGSFAIGYTLSKDAVIEWCKD